MADRLTIAAPDLVKGLELAAQGVAEERSRRAAEFALRLVRELAPGPGNPGNLRSIVGAVGMIASRPPWSSETHAAALERIRDRAADFFRVLDGEPVALEPTDEDVEAVFGDVWRAVELRDVTIAAAVSRELAEHGLALVRVSRSQP